MNIGPPEAGLELCVFSHLQLHSLPGTGSKGGWTFLQAGSAGPPGFRILQKWRESCRPRLPLPHLTRDL